MIEKKIVNIPSNLWAYKVRLECLTFLTSFFFLKINNISVVGQI